MKVTKWARRWAQRLIGPLDDDDPDLHVAIILLVALKIGANEAEVAAATGYDRGVVESVGARLRVNGVWQDGVTDASEWVGEFGGVGFMLDVMVGSGELERSRGAAPVDPPTPAPVPAEAEGPMPINPKAFVGAADGASAHRS